MQIFQLSHTDLDGYSCQLVTKRFAGTDEVYCYNSNYGPEVTAKLKAIESDVKRFYKKGEKVLLLITDLNITKDECDLADKIAQRFRFVGMDFSLQLLDHHGSGGEQARLFDWYLLDTNRSATKITLDYWKEEKPEVETGPDLERYVECVNAFDLWHQEESGFEFGKVLNRGVLDTKEVSPLLFPEENVAYRHRILETAYGYIVDDRYVDFDDDLLKHKKAFLAKDGERDTLDNLTAAFVTDLLTSKKEEMTFYYNGFKGILTFGIGNVSVLGNAFLQANPEFQFFLDVNARGNISIRAKGEIDVSKMAADLFDGGGHPNASGGRMGQVRDIFTYRALQNAVRRFIINKCGEIVLREPGEEGGA